MKSSAPLAPDQRAELPGPLYELLTLVDQEENAFRRVHRLIDAFEWAIKWHTVLVASDLLRERELPPAIRVLFATGLRAPSLGLWYRFFVECLAHLKTPLAPWAEWDRLTAIEEHCHVVAFRNEYAHGATPTDADCQQHCAEYHPLLLQLLGSPILLNVRLWVAEVTRVWELRGPERRPVEAALPEGQAAARLADGRTLVIWPLGSYAEHPRRSGIHRFFFFNALREPRLERLNYEEALRRRDRELWEPFHVVFPLQQWEQTTLPPDLDLFRQRIGALTETFKGRRPERRRLGDFCLNGAGLLLVWGAPGIGKSALLAQVLKEVRAGVDGDGLPLAGTFPPVIEYFVRRNEGRDQPVAFLRYLCRRLDLLFELHGGALGESEVRLKEDLDARLRAIEDSGRARRTVLLVDGLDEGPDLLRYLPAPRPWLVLLGAGRETAPVRAFFQAQDREARAELAVGPLGGGEVRALLADVVDQYDAQFSPAYVAAVVARSCGNPLYLKLLCEQLFHGERRLGEIAALPRKVEELFEGTLDRVTQQGRDQDALDYLYLLAEARAALSVQAAATFLGLNRPRAQAALNAARELLGPALGAAHDEYQLFHESLREWLRREHAEGCAAAAARLADAASRWRQLKVDAARVYVLVHGAVHLATVGDREGLWQLLQDEEYRQTQAQVCQHYQEAYQALGTGLAFYAARNGQAPEDDARLCWLMLRAGDLAATARAASRQAFDQAQARPLADPARVPEALARLQVLDEKNLVVAALLLLWLEADRQQEAPADQRSDRDARLILEAIERRLPPGRGSIAWNDFLAPEFMAWLLARLLGRWPGLPVADLCNRTNQPEPFVTALLAQLRASGPDQPATRSALTSLATTLIGRIESPPQRAAASAALATIQAAASADAPSTAVGACLDCLPEPLRSALLAGQTTLAVELLGRHLATLQAIPDPPRRYTAIIETAAAVTAAGLTVSPMTLIAGIGDDWWRSRALSAIAAAQAGRGATEAAHQTFAQTLDTLERVDLGWGAFEALAALAAALTEQGQAATAAAVLARAETAIGALPDESGRARSALALILAEEGLFEPAQVLAAGIPVARRRADTMAALAQLAVDAGQPRLARQLAKTALALAQQPPRQRAAWLAVGVQAVAAAAVGQDTEALTAAAEISSPEQRADALSRIAVVQGRAGRATQTAATIAQALAAIPLVQDRAAVAEPLARLAIAADAAGRKDQARDLLTVATAAVTAGGSRLEQVIGLATVGGGWAAIGDTAQATAVFQQALQGVTAIEGIADQSQGLTAVIERMFDSGRADDLATWLEGATLMESVWKRVLAPYRRHLAHTAGALPRCRLSFACFPFNRDVATEAVVSFLAACVRQRQTATVAAVLRQCPQLDLAFLG